MLSRRHLLLSFTALTLPASNVRRVDFRGALRSGRPTPPVALQLEDAPVHVLTGVPARVLSASAVPVNGDTEALALRVRGREAQVTWRPSGDTCPVLLHEEGEGFVAAWALPLLEYGLLGYAPAEVLPPLLAASRGEYVALAPGALPHHHAFLARPRAASACCFGAWESLHAISEEVERLQGLLPATADCVVTTALTPHHAPRLLLTAFFDAVS